MTFNKNVIRLLNLCILVFTLSIFIISCKKSEITEPQNQNKFSGISRADSTGLVLTEDPGDWEPISEAGMEFIPKGAYPNPAQASEGFTFCWHLNSTDSVVITINDSHENVLLTPVSRKLSPGQYSYHQRMGLFDPGIYRLYFHIVRPDTIYVTYGDIQIY